jgi:hypothetical protein
LDHNPQAAAWPARKTVNPRSRWRIVCRQGTLDLLRLADPWNGPVPYPALIRNASSYDLGFLNIRIERPAGGGNSSHPLRVTEKEPL